MNEKNRITLFKDISITNKDIIDLSYIQALSSLGEDLLLFLLLTKSTSLRVEYYKDLFNRARVSFNIENFFCGGFVVKITFLGLN